jgi:hypothetical protein
VIAVSAELYLRHTMKYADYGERNGTPLPWGFTTEKQLEPWLWIYPPSHDFEVVKKEFHHPYHVTSEGVVGKEIPLEKKPGEYRIIAFGDSFTEGMGDVEGGGYPKELERLLAEKTGSSRFHVYGAGVAGSDPVFYLELLRRRMAKYKPDLVLMTINYTNVQEYERRGGIDRFRPDGYLKDRLLPFWTPRYHRSHLVRAIATDFFHYDWELHSPAQAASRREVAIHDLIASANVGVWLANQYHFRPLFLIHPQGHHVFNGWTTPSELVAVENGLRQSGVDFADLEPYFDPIKANPNESEYYWPIDRHFNHKGYGLFALGIEHELEKRGIVPR